MYKMQTRISSWWMAWELLW